jgi:GNAT superfamily N-acetyltransferase
VNSDDVTFRRAVDSDAIAMADVWLRSYAAALPTIRRAHTDDEVRDWFSSVVVPGREAWVATAGGLLAGLMVLGDTDLEQLYLDPSWRGRGLGDRFIEVAKLRRPLGMSLWTFQVNGSAQRFYERHGFVAVEWTDGRDNEEHEPDIQYVWRPGQ